MRGPDSAIPPRGIGVWPSRQPQVGRGPRLVFCIDYRYDLCGNRVLRMRQPAESGRASATTYYDTNELNQLTRTANVERDEFLETYLIATTYFSYDMNGNTVARLTTDEEGLLTGATYYDWDAESQLVGVRSLAGLDNAFAYDGRYQRVEKQQAAGTVRYNWDGLNVLLERDGDDEPLATHTHGPVPIAGIGTHLTTRQHGETPEDLWVHHDAIGSTRQLSDGAEPPALTRESLLDAWGNLLATAGTQDTSYRFTGKETDQDTGLIYFGRRFYDPGIGRWLNRDPSRDGLNWYEYAASNPMARVDAEGLRDVPGQAGSSHKLPEEGDTRRSNFGLFATGTPEWLLDEVCRNPLRPRLALLFVWDYRHVIREAAARNGIPAALIAGQMLAEMESAAHPYHEWPSYLAHRSGLADFWATKKALDPDSVAGLKARLGWLQRCNEPLYNQIVDVEVATLGPMQVDVKTAMRAKVLPGVTTHDAAVRALLDPVTNIQAGAALLGKLKANLAARLEGLTYGTTGDPRLWGTYMGWRTRFGAGADPWDDMDLRTVERDEAFKPSLLVGVYQDQANWRQKWEVAENAGRVHTATDYWYETVMGKIRDVERIGLMRR